MNYNRYFRSIEDRFLDIARYIDINEKNLNTFSSEIAITYMAATSEVEVVLKELCKCIQPNVNYTWKKFNYLAKVVSTEFPNMFSEIVCLDIYKIELRPFDNWRLGHLPQWWTFNNELKHNRSLFYEQANIRNLLDAIAALHIVNYYLIWKQSCRTKSRLAPPLHMDEHPKLFLLKDVNYNGPFFDDDVFDI